MLASAGIDRNSAAVYPKASATAVTPLSLLDSELSATAPYFARTDSRICSAIALPPGNIYAKANVSFANIFVKAYK
jgi:hypothetical protein